MPGTTVAETLAGAVRQFVGDDLPVRIRAWDGSEAGPADAPVAVIRNRRALRRLLWHPDELGLARAYVTGDLDVEGDLDDGFRRVWTLSRAGGARTRDRSVHISRRDQLAAAGLALRLGIVGLPPRAPASEAKISGRLHSRSRDRAVIAHHYDLSNEFYSLILDEHMAYSCAYFTSDAPGYTLADAQRDKLDLVCRKLALAPGMRLLDVGCGWGSLSIHAAQHYGVQVTGVTLSREQLDFARKRAADIGVQDLVEFRLQDYRDVADGPYDAASSIEMGEHVGAENYPVFVATVQRLLRPEGRFLVQQMSRAAGNAPGGGPFIEAYIAPDMHMRPVGETVGLLEAGGFEVRDVHALREHYVRTAGEWRANFESRWDDVVALVGEEVARVWRLYLVGGTLAFEERRMGVDQILAVKPTADGRSGFAPGPDSVPERQGGW